MINIKRFIDKIASVEGRQGKDVIIPIAEARGLRDELAKLLADQVENNKQTKSEEPIEVQIVGGRF
jgi:hypothetical protein